MFAELLTLGIIALGLAKGKNHATGIGRIKRRIYVEIEAAQNKGVDLEQKFMELPNSQKISLEETGRSFGWKQSKRSAESGKTYAEAYFNSLKRAYNAISGISPIGATPYTSHSVRNGDGHVILTWRDYAPAEEHVQAEAPAVTKPRKKKTNKKDEDGVRRFGSDYEDIRQNKEHLYQFYEHLCVITNSLIEMAKNAGRTEWEDNQLLRECYNLVDRELHTYGEWEDRGLLPDNGEHPYLFWEESSLNVPCEKRSENDVLFLYCKEQVSEKAYEIEHEDDIYLEQQEAELRKRRNKLRRSGRLQSMALDPEPNLQSEEPSNTDYVPVVVKTKQQQILDMWPWLRTYDSEEEAVEVQPDGSNLVVYPKTDTFNYVVWKTIKSPSGEKIAEGPVAAYINRQAADFRKKDMQDHADSYDSYNGNKKAVYFSVKSVADVKLDRIAGVGYVDLYEDWY